MTLWGVVGLALLWDDDHAFELHRLATGVHVGIWRVSGQPDVFSGSQGVVLRSGVSRSESVKD